jgi:quinol monooxygenase YgiN
MKFRIGPRQRIANPAAFGFVKRGFGALAMLLITGTFRVRPEKLAEARPVMEAMILASRAEDGCLGYAYAVDLLDSGLVHVAEAWRDQAALDAHFSSAHIARWRAAWSSLGITERNLTLHEVSGSRPT